MGRKEDVAVGAFARAERRRHTLVALAGVALLAGAVGLFLLVRRTTTGRSHDAGALIVRCIKCGREYEAAAPAGTVEDAFWCAACGERSARKLWQCLECGAVFVPTGRERLGESIEPVLGVDPEHLACPVCGSRLVGTADKERPRPPTPGSGERN